MCCMITTLITARLAATDIQGHAGLLGATTLLDLAVAQFAVG